MTDATITTTLKIEGFQPVDIVATVTLEPETTPEPPEPTPPPVTDGWLTVEIDYEGTVYTFHEEDGTDLGDYIDPHFIQRCILATGTLNLPGFRVFFRCDRDSDRAEVVFELGDTTVGAVAANMGAYTATIYEADEVLARIEVPEHYWYSRWRWESAPREIVADIAQLQLDGLLPTFGTSLATTRPLSDPKTYTPMGLAGLTAYGPTTGERDEIGLVTEAQAEYLRGEALPGSLFAQGEASGTLPWHYRNEDGGGIFDFKAHPNATVYYPATIPTCSSPVQPDAAHEPPLAYVPFLLTGDPYYLEEMQFAATFNVLCAVPSQRGNYCIGFALRAHAWALRVLAQCARVTPEDVPSWLQPRDYWLEWLDQERDWMLSRYVNPTGPPFTEVPYKDFHFMVDAQGSPATTTLPGNTYNSPWMEDYEAAVLGHVVQMGHADWQPILEWKLANTVARTNGTSGWMRARTTPYTMPLRETEDAPYAADWPAVWDLNVDAAAGVYRLR
jgi:hypothetical protein